MNLSDLIAFSKANHAQGAALWAVLMVVSAGALGLIAMLLWSVIKTGKNAAYSLGFVLLVNAIFVFHKAADHDGNIAGCILLVASAVVFLVGALFITRPDPDREQLREELAEENRSTLKSGLGRALYAALGTVFFGVAYAMWQDKAPDSAEIAMVLGAMGTACLLASLFPKAATNFLDRLNSLNRS